MQVIDNIDFIISFAYRLIRNQQVAGSSPAVGSFIFSNLQASLNIFPAPVP